MKREKEINNAILNSIDILVNRRLETSNFNILKLAQDLE